MSASPIEMPARLSTTKFLAPYLLAVASTGSAAAIVSALWSGNRDVVFTFYYLAVILSAVYGHTRAVALAATLSILSIDYSFVRPYGSFSVTLEGAYTLFLFALVSGVTTLLIERLRTSEERLRESEDLFGKAFHSSPAGIAISRSDGRYVEMNDAFAEIIGYTRQEAIGNSAVGLGLLSADERERYAAEVRGKTGFRDRAFTGRNRTGEERHLLVSAEPISFHGELHYVGTYHDITGRKQAEDAMRAQAAQLDNAQRIGGMGSWTLDLRTGRVIWPEPTCHLFGIAPTEFTGTFEQFHSFILPEDVPIYDAANAHDSSSNPVFEAEYRIRRPDGAVRWMYSRGHIDRDSAGNPISRAGMVMDITDQRAEREQLTQRTALLRTAGRVAHLGGWTLSLPDRKVTWSDENCAIHDVPPGYVPTFEEGIGYYDPEDRVEVIRILDACVRDGKPYDFELPKTTAKGRRIWTRSVGEAVRDAEGKIRGIQGSVQDISDRWRTEEALRESEAQFRTLAESMPQKVWMTRPDGWNTYFNQRWVDYTGLSLEESYGDGWYKPFHPDDQQRARDGWQQAMNTGDYRVECRLRRRDGSYRWMLVRGLPARDGAGRITKWIGTCTDIDDVKHAQNVAQKAERVQRELAAELDAERARLVAAQAVAGVGSWETELASRKTIWSAETHRIFETDLECFEPARPTFLQIVHPEDRAAVNDALDQSVHQFSPVSIEHRLVMPDGRLKFVELRWEIVRDEHNRPVRAIGTCQEITDRRLAQEEIRKQAHMLDQIGRAVIATDTDGRITYANRFAGELYGWDATEMRGLMVTDVVPQLSAERGGEIMARLQRGQTWSGELPVQSRNGRAFPAFVTNSPLLDGRGRLIGIVGISSDISARKQAEESIRQKDALMRIAGRVTGTGGWTVEMPGQIPFWSDELCDILDYPRGHVPALAEALALYLPPYRDTIIAALTMCARDGRPFDVEVEISTARGRRKWVRVCGEAGRDPDGCIRRVQGAFQDITERKQLEQQYLRAQRMESIGTLAGGIAHDLNNVLAPILLSIGLLRQDEQDADKLGTLATIEICAKRGAAMIGRVLSFARGVEGQRVDVQVPPLVRDLATIVRDTFPRNIGFEERLGPGLWTLRADPNQIHQVLLNLCVNARDAMPAGGRITITAKNAMIDEPFAAKNTGARTGPYVAMEIEDTGAGIPPEIIERIFDPFFTTKEQGKGTGLGLSTSLAIVKGHGGFMRAYSSPGAGARFQFYLPAQTTTATPAPPAVAAANPRGNGETVLVVDDEVAIRQMAGQILETFGYKVLLAGDGAEAVAIYMRHQADIAVVFTDMMMPVMNGAAMIQELVRLNPRVRVICTSGLADENNAACGGASGAGFLPKPYTAETLLGAMRAALTHP